jgi:pSer/pThr/pTyr-binding forkhead associated (FHA) protein
MDVRLIIEKGPTKARTIRLRSETTIVGRQEGCGLRIPSATVSRRHCRLCFQNGYLTVDDLDSANGTLLNGQQTAGKQVVRPGDRLEIGPLVFLVEYQLTQAAIERLLRAEDGQEPPEDFVEALPFDEESEASKVDLAPLAAEVQDQEGAKGVVLLDDAEPWQLPEAQELRNILSKLDDQQECKG